MCSIEKCKECEVMSSLMKANYLCGECLEKALASTLKNASNIFPHNINDQMIELGIKALSDLGFIENLNDVERMRSLLIAYKTGELV